MTIHKVFLTYDPVAKAWKLSVPTPRIERDHDQVVFKRHPMPPSQGRRDEALQKIGWRRVSSWLWREDQSGDMGLLSGFAVVELHPTSLTPTKEIR